MEKIWLNNYPENVPAEINPDAYESLVELFEECCKKFGNRPAVSNMGTVLTYDELNEKSRAFAAFLQQELGMKKGERVAIMLPNCLQYYVVMLGVLQAGLIVVNVNPLYTHRELVYQLSDSAASALVVLANFADVVSRALPDTHLKHVIVTEIGDLFNFPKAQIVNFVVKYIKRMVPNFHIDNLIKFKNALARGRKSVLQNVTIRRSDIAYLQYTGGTTGVAKGAMLTHRNMIANIEQVYAWVSKDLKIGHAEVISPLPLYHVFSLTVSCWCFLKVGGHSILITNPRDIPNFIKELKKLHFTVFVGLNTLFNALLNHPDFKDVDFSNLDITVAGGMALQHAIAEKWHALTGNWITEGYGLTEASPVVTVNPIVVHKFKPGIGVPLPSTEISIRDKEGKEVGIGETGELLVKGPQVMKGYWHQEHLTEKSFTEDGWLHTGDVVQIDEKGHLCLIDRLTDMVIVSGFNVYPNIVEGVLAEHPGILEVAVIGVRDEHAIEILKAFIVKKDPNLTKEEVLRFAHENLTAYKVPKLIEFRDELPKSNIGKVLRRALRDEKNKNLK